MGGKTAPEAAESLFADLWSAGARALAPVVSEQTGVQAPRQLAKSRN